MNSTAEVYRIPVKERSAEVSGDRLPCHRADLEYPKRVVATLQELAERGLVPTSDVLVDRLQSFDSTG